MMTTSFIEGLLGCLGFVALMFFGSKVLPGPLVTITGTENGELKRYRLNGFSLLVSTVVAVAALAWFRVWSPLTILGHFKSLFIAANIFAFFLLFILFLEGRRKTADAPGGAIRNLRDFFRGTQLNPEWFGVDLKLFSYRPSLIGLALINVSFAFAQYETYGRLTARMWLYQILYFVYIANYFQFERGMLFTWDVIAERFGWMLAWGDYVLVPFLYSLPGWYLIHNTNTIAPSVVAAIVALFVFGFWLFRGANGQKHQFKRNPDAAIWGRPTKTIGGKLLVSGFWGVGRKLNYTGELCMYYAWTLLCGFESVVPYLLPLWLTAFLLHRAWRDDQRCRAKYGDLWVEYCRQARFRMLPFIY